jgi:hypothetical protein
VFVPNSGAINNDRGQVLFSATLTDGRGVLLLDTPGPDQQGQHGGVAQASTAETALDASSLIQVLAAGEMRLAEAVPVTFLASNIANPSARQDAALPVQPVAVMGPFAIPWVGGDNHSPLTSSPQRLTASAGALPEPAVDALFADLGTRPLGDPVANGTW